MECNRDEALRAKTIAEGKLENKDFAGAKKFALKAQSLYPGLDGLSQMLTTIHVYVSAENKISGEVDWYGVLGVNPTADDETVRKQYRKLALLLHPDKNRTFGANGAFKLLCEGWSLLSDKSKRFAYNMRRSPKGFQQKVPTQTSGPSVPPRANGCHNYTGRTVPKSQNANARVPPTSVPPRANGYHNYTGRTVPKSHNANARVPPTSVVRPCQRTDTFWTICHRCKMHYEYLKVYLNHTLLCPNCHEAFLASETAPPFNYSKSSASRHRHQNLSNHAPTSNFLDPRRNSTASAKDSGQDRFARSGSVGSTDPSIAAKAADVVQQAHERMKRERDASQAAAGWEGSSSYNFAFEGEGVYKKTRLDDGYHYGANTAHHRTMGNGSSSMAGTSAPRKTGFEYDKVHGFSGAYSTGNSIRELTPVENRNMLMAKARNEILKKLSEWRLRTANKAVETEQLKMKDRKKEKERSTRNDNGRDPSGFVESSATRQSDQAEKSAANPAAGDIDKEHVVAEAINVPDPDFHDFDLDRAESSFGENEVWAAYDDDDGMPRFYAMVNKVISRKPFKLRISWLNSKTSTEFGRMDWIGSGFYKTCGEFRLGRYESNKSINSFSHKVKWSKVRGVVHIFPKKGEVWALYKNWSPDWNENTPEELIHKYDMMVVLVDYDQEQGASVAPLVKVAGFKTVFLPNLNPEKVMKIPKEEMFRFSHQVPNYQLTGEEDGNAPKGCLELDPAATPLDLLHVITEASKEEVKEHVLQNVPEARADETADNASEAKKEGMVEIEEDVEIE